MPHSVTNIVHFASFVFVYEKGINPFGLHYAEIIALKFRNYDK